MFFLKKNQNENQIKIKQLQKSINEKILIDPFKLELILSALFCHQHILLEDHPGTGKTSLAKAISEGISLKFNRIQLTPDLMPSDIIGVSIFDPKNQSFKWHKGPVFTQILLADEINRASPKTQSALLEAMAEKQVSVDGKTEFLDQVFFVIATQNSIESRGTYLLPEAQLDRFAIKLGLGFMSLDQEVLMLKKDYLNNTSTSNPVMTETDLMIISQEIDQIQASDHIYDYIVKIVQATRNHSDIIHGAGPRGSIHLLKLVKAYAYIRGNDFVTHEDVRLLAPFVLNHRIQSRLNNSDLIIENIIKSIKIK